MADIELVIKIPEETYKSIKHGMRFKDDVESIMTQIENGTPLPKGHGDLIDAREYENDIRKHYFDNRTVIRCTEIALDNATTIVEADEE